MDLENPVISMVCKVVEHICNIHTLLNKAKFTIDDVVIDEIQGEVSGLCQCLL